MATKKKKDIKIQMGILHVQTTQNNTIVTLTDERGNKILWWWTGLYGFKGARQNTPYAAEVTTKEILKEAQKYGLQRVGIVMKGIWLGREGVFKAINDTGNIEIEYIKENTPLQHGWCKRKRPKRN